jgi:hypothetical protein
LVPSSGVAYKYLGIELTKRGHRKSLRHYVSLWPELPACEHHWMSLVRSIIEHGCEIWGEGCFVDLEKLQISMGKRILRCGSRMTEEVVR